MKKNSLVTIAIPAYKKQYLKEAIESVLKQDYDNIELIIVDDHSPQLLYDVVEPYLKDVRIKYTYNECNLGHESIAYNWNRCVDLASGDFFVLLCDDDLLMPTFVSDLVKLANKYPHCDVFHGGRMVKNEITGDVTEDPLWPEFLDYDTYLVGHLKGKFRHTISEFLYRTPKIKKSRYIIMPMGWGSDDASIIQMVRTGGIVSVDKYNVCFRRSTEHISYPYSKVLKKVEALYLLGNWLLDYEPSMKYHKLIIDFMDCKLYSSFLRAKYVEKLAIIWRTPTTFWGFKKKLFLFLTTSPFRKNI